MNRRRLAVASKAGNTQATTDFARRAFINAGIPDNITDSFGFTNRIVNAEMQYRKGAHAPLSEVMLVQAVNNLAASIRAPQWARTNAAEVRKLRMHMLVNNPQLFGSKEPGDSSGHYKAVSDSMTPVEGSYIATALLFQKTQNPAYQFTTEEKALNETADPKAVHAAQQERVAQLQNLLQGRTESLSIRDLPGASDRFFSDLGIEPVPGTQTVFILMQGGYRRRQQ